MKKAMKFVSGFVGVTFIIIFVFWGSFVYVSNYKITKADTSVSPDGTYELVLQAVGKADFPFGSASGRLVLYEGKSRISKADFELRDDGRNIRSSTWEVTWHEDYVEVFLSGEEQFEEQIILYFDGTIDYRQLTAKYSDTRTEFYQRDLVTDSGKEEMGNIIPEWVTESERDMRPFYVVTGSDEQFDQFVIEEFPDICDAYWTQEQSDAVYLGHAMEIFSLDGQKNGNKTAFYPVILNGTIVSVLVVYLDANTMTLGWQMDPNKAGRLNILKAYTSPDAPVRIGYNRNNLIAVIGGDYYLLQSDFMLNEEVDVSLIPPENMDNYSVVNVMESLCNTRTADVSDWTVTDTK